jgi:hypothetical protein
MCTLLLFIDDATSRLMHLQFVETESTFPYFAATRGYLEAHAMQALWLNGALARAREAT